jgi:hypothetical protein
MTPISKSLSMSSRDLLVLVHLTDERPDLTIGELIHAVAEERLVFGKPGQRGKDFDLLLHGRLSVRM